MNETAYFSGLNEELKAVAEYALQRVERNLIQQNGIFDLFAVLRADDKNTLKQFIGNDAEELLDEALNFLEDIDAYPDIAVIAYPKKINISGKFYSSIYMHLYGADEVQGYSFAKAFQVNGDELFFTDVLYTGAVRNVLLF